MVRLLSIFRYFYHLLERTIIVHNGGIDMAKRNRGKALNKLPGKGRGECPLCHRKRIKLIYPHRTETNETIDVCKNCKRKE